MLLFCFYYFTILSIWEYGRKKYVTPGAEGENFPTTFFSLTFPEYGGANFFPSSEAKCTNNFK